MRRFIKSTLLAPTLPRRAMYFLLGALAAAVPKDGNIIPPAEKFLSQPAANSYRVGPVRDFVTGRTRNRQSLLGASNEKDCCYWRDLSGSDSDGAAGSERVPFGSRVQRRRKAAVKVKFSET